MKKLLLPAVLCVGLLVSGCYHATVETGKAASGEVIEEPFALSFVYGLVPPSTVDVENECANGVAKVETQISFVNGLVRSLTGGLVTPMTITVTCAQASNMSQDFNEDNSKTLTLDRNASETQTQSTYKQAADKAVQQDDAVYISYE